MRTLGLALLMLGPPEACLAAGNSLTMTASTYDAVAAKFAGALSGGYGSAVVAAPAGSSFTWEAWARLAQAPGQPVVAIGSGAVGYLGANAQGQEVCNISSGNTTITGPSLLDGNWHLLDLVGTPSGVACFLDGSSVGTAGVSQTVPQNATLGVGTMGLYAGNNVWPGEIDEASIWNVPRYGATFLPPTTPYRGSESGLLALWHLNGNGVDYANDTVLQPNDPSILYSPFNWSVGSSAAMTINAGAYFRTMFTGSACTLNFDLSTAAAPASEIYWRVDGYEAGQPWIRTTPAANVPCPAPADLGAAPWHQLEVVVKSTSETINRWNTAAPGTAVRFAGLSLQPGASAQTPVGAPWRILLLGDSITEGVRTVNQTASLDTDRNDATLGWAFRLGRLMGAEVGVVGFGATGFTAGGSGGVPPLTSSYNQLASNLARPAGNPPSLIVINDGTNDPGDVTVAATTVLNALIAQYPDTPIALLVPFNQSHIADLQAAARNCVRPGLVHVVQTAGILNPSNGVDNFGVHPTGPNNLGFIAPRLASLLTPILVGGPTALTAAQLARIP